MAGQGAAKHETPSRRTALQASLGVEGLGKTNRMSSPRGKADEVRDETLASRGDQL
jgi:hypothetical protein